MDPTKLEKLQAMKRCRSQNQLLLTLIHYSLSALMFGLFLSSPLWLPSAISSLNLFFMVSLPKIGATVFGPKCLFIVSNVIVLVLVGDSKLSKSSPTPDVYEEFTRRNRSLSESKEDEGMISETQLVEDGGEEEEEEKGGGEELDGEEEERGLPADELNRRVEDFIARVNMQRRVEARMLVCCG